MGATARQRRWLGGVVLIAFQLGCSTSYGTVRPVSPEPKRLSAPAIETLMPVLRWEGVDDEAASAVWDVVVFNAEEKGKRRFEATRAAYYAEAVGGTEHALQTRLEPGPGLPVVGARAPGRPGRPRQPPDRTAPARRARDGTDGAVRAALTRVV